MAGISGIGGAPGVGGPNPLGGMAGATSLGGSLSGMGDLGLGGQDRSSSGGNGSGLGLAPVQPASQAQGASFGSALQDMVVHRPSASKAASSALAARFAAGDTSIDPHQLALASAKAGVEIQMATRTISSAVSAVRTLFQMQV